MQFSKFFLTIFVVFCSLLGWGEINYVIKLPDTRFALSHDDVKKIKSQISPPKDYISSLRTDSYDRLIENLKQVQGSKLNQVHDKTYEDFSKSLIIVPGCEDEWEDMSTSFSLAVFEENREKDKKINHRSKTDAVLKEAQKNQLVKTLAHLGNYHCRREQCGEVPCAYAAEFKIRKEANGDIYFTKLNCSNRIEDAFTAGDPDEISVFYVDRIKADEADALEEEVSAPVEQQGYYSWITSFMPGWSVTTTYVSNVVKTTGQAIYDDVTTQPIANIWDPTRIARTATNAMLAATVLNGYQVATGAINELDWSTIPDLAKEHLERGKGLFSSIQVTRVRSWIAESEKRLRSYGSNKSEESEKFKRAASDRTTTIKKLIDRTEEAAKATVVTEAMLIEKEDFALRNLLKALQDFLRMPYHIAKSTPEQVDARIKKNPLYGGESFKKKIYERAHIYAENSSLDVKKQNKKVIISASGPGTGKTYGLEGMAQFAGIPSCTLRAEDIKKWDFKNSKLSAFQMIMKWAADCMMNNFVDENGVHVMNGFLLFDDIHYSFLPSGIFGNDKEGRDIFFSTLVKNGGDPSTESLFALYYGQGDQAWPDGIEKDLPLNTQRVHLGMTFNEVPPELNSKTGDQPTIDRTTDIHGAYLTKEERRGFALDMLRGNNGIIEGLTMRVGKEEVKKLDLATCEKYLMAVAEEDIRIAFTDFGGKFGFRGLLELLKQYKAHVMGKASKPLASDICSFAGKVAFDPVQVIAGIQSYHGSINEKMKKDEINAEMTLISKRLQNEIKTSALSPLDVKICEEQLAIIENQEQEEELRRAAIDEIKSIIKEGSNFIELPDISLMEKNINKNFGHLRAGDGNEIDRFTPMVSILEDIHQRLAQQRKGNFNIANKIIRIGYTDEHIVDPRLADKLAKTLGNLPVLNVTKGSMIAFLRRPHDPWQLYVDSSALDKFSKLQGAKVTIKNIIHKGVRKDSALGYCEFVRGRPGYPDYFAMSFDAFDDKPFYVLLSQNMFKIVKAFDNSQPFELSWFSFMSNPSQEYRTRFEPTLRNYLEYRVESPLLETVYSRREQYKSNAESIISITLNPDVMQAITTWHKKAYSFNSSEESMKESLLAFMNYLQRELNSDKGIRLENSFLDGRRLTVIFSAPGEKIKEILFNPAFEEKLDDRQKPIDVILGAPPINGRSRQARNILLGSIGEILNGMREIGSNVPTEVDLEPNEERMLALLIDFDQKIALRARDQGLITPVQLLDRGVAKITDIVKRRIKNYFGLKIEAPTDESLMRDWQEIYKPHTDEIEAVIQEKIREKEREELKRQEQLQKEQQEREERHEREREQKAAQCKNAPKRIVSSNDDDNSDCDEY